MYPSLCLMQSEQGSMYPFNAYRDKRLNNDWMDLLHSWMVIRCDCDLDIFFAQAIVIMNTSTSLTPLAAWHPVEPNWFVHYMPPTSSSNTTTMTAYVLMTAHVLLLAALFICMFYYFVCLSIYLLICLFALIVNVFMLCLCFKKKYSFYITVNVHAQ